MIALLHGDAFRFISSVPPRFADLILTDPPYGRNACVSKTSTQKKMKMGSTALLGSFGVRGDTFVEMKPIALVAGALKNDSYFLLFCGGMDSPFWHEELSKAVGLRPIAQLVWDKRSQGMLSKHFAVCHELIWIFARGQPRPTGRRNFSILSVAIPHGRSRRHSGEKPVGLLESLLSSTSRPNDLVFDPFAGSGSTGVACARTGRHFLGCEIDKETFEYAKERIENACRIAGRNGEFCSGTVDLFPVGCDLSRFLEAEGASRSRLREAPSRKPVEPAGDESS